MITNDTRNTNCRGSTSLLCDSSNYYEEEEEMNNLISQVEQWSMDKDLHKANPDRQALKVWEESGEIAAALSRNDKEALMDGIGDTVVTLIILAQQHGMTLERCLQYAYDEIKGRTGKTINGTFVKSEDLPQDEAHR